MIITHFGGSHAHGRTASDYISFILIITKNDESYITSLSPPAPSSKRAPPMASISSKKIKHAFLDLAISNNSLTIRAPSPTYFWTNSDPITLIKQASVRLATARAQRVFPVPGGPKSNTPFGGSIPNLTNFSGYKRNIYIIHEVQYIWS